jgi:FKBP-type peptidyl-prolyl cis-trans isomerase
MSNRVWLIAAAVMLLAAIGVAVYGTSEPAVAPPRPIPTEAPAPAHAWQDASLTEADGMRFAILKEGAGRSPVDGDLVSAVIKGWVKSTEHPFLDTTGQDARAVLGTGEMVEGVRLALTKMKAGEIRQIHLPPDLAYGQTGQPPRIPHDAEVVFEIELRSVEEAPVVPEHPPEMEPDQETDGVRFAVVQAGTGPEAKAGDTIRVHFTTWLKDGTLVDSTVRAARPVDVKLGEGRLYAGLEAALTGMKAGETRKAVIPPEKAFGSSARGPIPPNSTLVVQADLLQIL